MNKWLLIDFTFRDKWAGTYREFGFRSWLTLVSPLANTVLNWNYRNWELEIPDLDE